MFDAILKKIRSSDLQGLPLVEQGQLVYAIGDIHGRADLLNKIFDLIKVDFEREHEGIDRVYLVFLGDYVDRGLQSKSVVDLIISQEWGDINAVFLRGNHEQTLLDFLENPQIGPQWLDYGGRETLMSYGVQMPRLRLNSGDWEDVCMEFRERLPANHLTFFRSLRTWFELGNCYFVHAGVDPSRSLEMQSDSDRMWIRDKFLDYDHPLDRVIVHGHTPEENPIWDGRRIGIDTGAYITNRLTAARIDSHAVKFLST